MQIIPTTTGIKKNLENELSVPGAEIGQKTGKSFMGTLVKTIAGTAALKTAVDGVKKIIGNYADYEQLVGGVETLFATSEKSVKAYSKNIGTATLQALDDSAWENLGRQVYESSSALKNWSNDVGSSMDIVADALTYGVGTPAQDASGFMEHLRETCNMTAEDAEVMFSAVSETIKGNTGQLGDYISKLSETQDAESIVMENARNAWETAGLSANDYMETVTGFSASLIQSLGGDTVAAAELANTAIVDMSDNANKMGSSMESIQNAYQGFAKQNYTMLDNLKLGYGGTAQEMYRLMKDAANLNEEFAKTADFSIDSRGHLEAGYADIVRAIHIVQDEMGIINTTRDEAFTTISGSANAMKAAWTNLLTGLADENANFSGLVGNFTESLVTYADNLMPRIGQAMDGVGTLLTSFAETVLPKIIDYIIADLPQIIKTGINVVVKLAEGLIKAIPQLVQKIPQIITAIVGGLKSAIPELLNVGVQMIKGVWDGIVSMGSWIKEKVKNFFSGVTDAVKGILGIHSPSKVFAGIGGYMAEGLGVGFGGEIDRVQRDIKNDMGGLVDGVTMSGASINASVSGGVASNQTATQIGEQTFNLVLDGSVVSSFLVDVVRKEVRMA